MEKKKKFFQKLLGFVFGEPVKVQHPFWGELVDTGDDYEGKKFFESINQPLGFWLKKTRPELEAKQIAFFQDLNSNYANFVVSVSPATERAVSDWITGYQIKDFKEEFILVFLHIPDCMEENQEWEISFYADNDLQHWCNLEMKGMEVLNIMIDG